MGTGMRDRGRCSMDPHPSRNELDGPRVCAIRRCGGNPTKRGAECARPTETDLERHLGNGSTRICQQSLRAFHAARRPVAMWRLSEGPLERTQEMIRTQSHKLAQRIKRDVFRKVLLDKFHHASLLPWGKPATVG